MKTRNRIIVGEKKWNPESKKLLGDLDCYNKNNYNKKKFYICEVIGSYFCDGIPNTSIKGSLDWKLVEARNTFFCGHF